MSHLIKKQKQAELRRKRIRGKIRGTADRPRLTVFRSNKYTYLQVIDDDQGKTLASSNELALGKGDKKALTGTKSDRAKQIAEDLATKLSKQSIKKLAFDRGSYRYHGRLKVVADYLREKGFAV